MSEHRAVDSHDDGISLSPTQLDGLVDLGRELFELFRDEQDRPFARVLQGGAGGALRLPSREARHGLQRAYRDHHGRYPRPQAVTDALDALAAEAVHEGLRRPVFLRTGSSDDGIVLDLADERGRTVAVRAGGWRVQPHADVEFVRRGLAKPLPHPAEPAIGTVEPLREVCNIADEDEFRLVVEWLLMAMRPRGPTRSSSCRASRGQPSRPCRGCSSR